MSRPELENLPQGWFHHGEKILSLVEQYKPRVYVELGSWRGASAIAVARMVRQWRGSVTCVDTWTSDAIFGGVSDEGVAPPVMVGECAANLVAAGVAAHVRLIVAPSADAAKAWTEPIDFLYIDADHSYAAVLQDLELWAPHVKPGGVIAGDDYGHPQFPGVRMAWNYYALEHGFTFERYTSPGTLPGMEFVYGVKGEHTWHQ